MQTFGLTASQRAGQRLLVGFEGTVLNDEIKWLIKDLAVAGLILFSPNIETPAQVKCLCQDAQAFAKNCGQPPLFIAVDQEGGLVARFRAPFTEFKGNPAIRDESEARHFARTTATELKAVGVNINFAPVLDIAPAGFESIMANRAFGHDPRQVSWLGRCVIDELQAHRMMATAKHFPGIGRTVLDSHLDRPCLLRSEEELSEDLIPFKAAITAGVAGIMLSHVLYPDLDPEWPASLSPRIVQDLLRNQLGYTGLVMTDDLDMGAIGRHEKIETVIDQTVAAGIDLILICHRGPNIEKAHRRLQKNMRQPDGKTLAKAHLARILEFKRRYCPSGYAFPEGLGT